MNPQDLVPAFLELDNRQDGVKAILSEGPDRGKPVFLRNGGKDLGVVPYQTAYFHKSSLIPMTGKGNSVFFRAVPVGSRSFDRDTVENRNAAIREANEVASRFVAANATNRRVLPAKNNEERFPRFSFLVAGKFGLCDFITISLAGFGDEEETGKFYELVSGIDCPTKGFNPSLEVGSALKWGKDTKASNAMVLVGPTEVVAKCFRYVAEVDQRPWRVVAVAPNESGDKVAITATFREKEESIEELEGIRSALIAKGNWKGSMVDAMEGDDNDEDEGDDEVEMLEVTPPALPQQAPSVIIPVPAGMMPPPPLPEEAVEAPQPVSASELIVEAETTIIKAPTPPPADLATVEDLQSLQIGGVPPLPPGAEED